MHRRPLAWTVLQKSVQKKPGLKREQKPALTYEKALLYGSIVPLSCTSKIIQASAGPQKLYPENSSKKCPILVYFEPVGTEQTDNKSQHFLFR